jgi:hypothetical protein
MRTRANLQVSDLAMWRPASGHTDRRFPRQELENSFGHKDLPLRRFRQFVCSGNVV